MRVFWRAGRMLSRKTPPTGHAGRMLSRKTLQSGCAGQVPPRHQLRGRTLTPQCACKPLDMHMGGAAHTHTIGPTDGASGPRAPSGVHTQARDAVFTGTRQTRPTKIVTFPRDKAEKLSLPATRFVHPQSWPPTTLNQTFSHHKAERSGSDQLFLSFNPTLVSYYPGPRRERVDTLGMKKALPKECFSKTQNPHRWIAPRGAAARPKGLEPPTF